MQQLKVVYPFDRLPKKPTPPYTPRKRRQGEAAAMTMIAGFKCEGGIVLCADRQITSPGYFKYQEKKILASEGSTWKLTFAYSGLPGLAKEAKEKISRTLQGMDPEEVDAKVVQEVTGEVLDSMGRQYTDLQLQLLIAVAEPVTEPTLLKFDGKGLHIADDFNYLGCGDTSLLRFLCDVLYSSKLSIQQGMALAAYLQSRAGKYVDGVGGPIDIAVFHWLGDKHISQEEIANSIAEMEEKEKQFAELLIGRASSTSP